MLSLKLLYRSPLALLLRWGRGGGEVVPASALLSDMEPGRARYVSSIPDAQFFRGVLLQGYLVPPDVLTGLEDMEIRDDDVFVISYPKSGTTWTEEIVSLICRGGDVRGVEREPLIDRVHHLEVGRPFGHLRFLRKLKSPRLMATHLPLELLPREMREGKCKIVYVIRNPKDTAVSYYHHHRMSTFLGNTDATWEEFLDHFSKGHVVYGSWFDHVLTYWDFCKFHPDNVFFITYEELKLDLRAAVVRLSEFLGRPLSPGAVDAVVEHCSFDSMKANQMVNREKLPISDLFDMTKSKFMRKGIIGDWKNHFTPEQSDAFDEMCRLRMLGSDLPIVFDRDDAAALWMKFGGRLIPELPRSPPEAPTMTEQDVRPHEQPFVQLYLQSDPLTALT